MARYEDVINPPDWPYPVRYGEEKEISTDVLVVGGGIAGCHAAINAARKGVKVAIVDKGAVIRSGSGGAGVDHWHGALTNPCSKITPEQMIERMDKSPNPYLMGHVEYIVMKESYDALLDIERMGVPVRDVNDEFVGAPFRDDKTKLMFAYDYDTRTVIRVAGGANVKLALYNELKRLGVDIYDRVMITRLLTEGGRQGSRVVGATGINVRTGEFYVFKAKATILTTGQPLRIWVFSTELTGLYSEHDDPNNAGDGCAMAWWAGAELTLMENSEPSGGGFRYPAYGVGSAGNTWYACTIVDARGKEIPWVDRNGRIIKSISERYRSPTPLSGEPPEPARLIPDLPERIKKGEFVLPLYADIPSMPEHERRAIFGLMVGNEGKTRIPIYYMYTEAGFNPDKDMLQMPVANPEAYQRYGDLFQACQPGLAHPKWRTGGGPGWHGGGVVVDWDLRTTVEGLYAAGNQIAGAGGHACAAATGRYAGRKAAEYALKAKEPVIDREQVEKEKARVYAPVKRKDGIGWKELQAGICRVMQDYCGEYKNEETLKLGLWWLNSIRESECNKVYARNPHELWRTLECFVRLTVGEIIMHACLARKASSRYLNFKRLDYLEMDPPEWNKFITVKLENGKVKIGELPPRFWLKPPNAPTYEENYKLHCGL